MRKRLVLATLLAARRLATEGIAGQHGNCRESPGMQPYPGQRCRACKQEIQVGEIRAIFESVYIGEVVIDCMCAGCGTENAVLMVLSDAATGQ